MAKKKRSKALVRRVVRRPPPGSRPGYLEFDSQTTVKMTLHSYTENQLRQTSPQSLKEVAISIKELDGHMHWLDIHGFANGVFFEELRTHFDMHPLQLEDVLDTKQRPKLDRSDSSVFSISRMFYYNDDASLVEEQMNVFVFDKVLVTIQEFELDCLDPVRERLKIPSTLIRKSDCFYLFYAIWDAIIDNYFPVLDRIESELEIIEDALFTEPKREHLNEIQWFRRQILQMRKTIGAERENINELIRYMSPEKQERYGLYFRDTYEHCIQIIEQLEAQKDISFSLMDIYLSTINNRLSEVMKVLTVISSIFIPLSFIAGFYGMNFQREADGKEMPLNMPELYSPYGYLIVVGVMLTIGVIQLVFFRRKGWI